MALTGVGTPGSRGSAASSFRSTSRPVLHEPCVGEHPVAGSLQSFRLVRPARAATSPDAPARAPSRPRPRCSSSSSRSTLLWRGGAGSIDAAAADGRFRPQHDTVAAGGHGGSREAKLRIPLADPLHDSRDLGRAVVDVDARAVADRLELARARRPVGSSVGYAPGATSASPRCSCVRSIPGRLTATR